MLHLRLEHASCPLEQQLDHSLVPRPVHQPARPRSDVVLASTTSATHWHRDLVTQTTIDVKTVQSMLRHADIGTTLDIYTHAINKDKLVAQNLVMEAMLKPGLVN